MFVHGLGEHVARYDALFGAFAKRNIKTYGIDWRGFGQTGRKNGILGHTEGIRRVLRDLRAASDRIRMAGTPHFVMGHSMGGSFALRFALDYPLEVQGCILSAPLIKMGKGSDKPAWFISVVRFVARFLGSMTVNSELDINNLSRDPEEIKKFNEDPLIHPWISTRTAIDVMDSNSSIFEKDHKRFKVPIVILHGSADTLTDPAASRELIDKMPVQDKSFIDFPGAFHERNLFFYSIFLIPFAHLFCSSFGQR